MKDLINMMSRQMLAEETVTEYYNHFFSDFAETDMFEVYDVERETFHIFPGREGSLAMNLKTLISRLSEMESNHASVGNFVVIKYDNEDINFFDPVFVGREDGFMVNNP